MPQRKNKAILIRPEGEDLKLNFKKFLSENKLLTYREGLKCLLAAAGSEVFQEYQDCDRFGEYPLDSKHFTQCIDPKSGKKVIRKREDCQACAHSEVIKVLMQSRGKIEQQNSESQLKLSGSQHKLGDLNADIVRKTREIEKIENLSNMPELLKKKEKEIADLTNYYEHALRVEQEKNNGELRRKENALKEETDKNKYLDEAYREMEKRCEELEKRLENLQTVPPSVLEVMEKLSEEKPPIPRPVQKVEASKPTQTIQKVTETETTTKKERIIETVTDDPFINREIECPLKGQYMDIAKECKKGCSDIFQCSFWPEINKGTVPQGAKIRVREG